MPDMADYATEQGGPKTDALVAEWMGWEERDGYWWERGAKTPTHYMPGSECDFRPSTNFAHAVEAMLKAKWSTVTHTAVGFSVDLLARPACRVTIDDGTATVYYSEVTGDTEEEIKALALALAICRAILAALQAAAEAKEEKDNVRPDEDRPGGPKATAN